MGWNEILRKSCRMQTQKHKETQLERGKKLLSKEDWSSKEITAKDAFHGNSREEAPFYCNNYYKWQWAQLRKSWNDIPT